jgi:hypothetical protein
MHLFSLKTKQKEIMRKILIIILIPLVGILGSCKKFVEKDQISPNSPVTAGPAQFLLISEVGTFQTETTELDRLACLLTQQVAGTTVGQFSQIANYDIREADDQDQWYSVYADALVNIQALIDKSGDANPYYRGMGEVLKAMNLGLATDTWGDVPDKAALKGVAATSDAFNPKFDAQQDIYADIQNLLTAAIADFNSPLKNNAILPGSDDIIHNGNIAAWLQNAWILKARYHNHLSKKDAGGSATDALADLASAKLTTSSNDLNAVFNAGSNSNINQWNAFQSNRPNYILMAKPFISLLKGDSDPRLPFYATKDTSGSYHGTPVDPDSTDLSASDVGLYLADIAAPMTLVSYVEARFIEAEANFRAGNKPAAATAYNDAVATSVKKVTGAAASAGFKNKFGSETASSITLQKIMVQKYIASFGQYEVWTDWRRTNIPNLNPSAGGVIKTIPRRLPTPLDERNYNKNAIVVDDITQPVWWDK